MLKKMLMKKMMQKQLQGVPEAEQDKLFAMVEKNPQLFQQIAVKVQSKIKEGKDQMTATMEVMAEYQDELKGLMGS